MDYTADSGLGTRISLRLARYRARFSEAVVRGSAKSDLAGDAWRRALGPALKRQYCVTGLANCKACPLYHECPFAYLWFTPPPRDAVVMRKYESAPHPYVLHPAGDAAVEFVLIGKANDTLAVFIAALEQAAVALARNARKHPRLAALEHATAFSADAEPHWGTLAHHRSPAPLIEPQIPPAPPACRIELLAPLRVKHQGRYADPQHFEFADLFGNLLRRISLMAYFHGGVEWTADFAALMQDARRISVHAELSRRRLQRPGRNAPWFGLAGRLDLRGAQLPALWPYLWLGQLIHAGSGATFGLGRYRIVAQTESAQQTAS